MSVTRRSFLKGIVAAATAALLPFKRTEPRATATKPVLKASCRRICSIIVAHDIGDDPATRPDNVYVKVTVRRKKLATLAVYAVSNLSIFKWMATPYGELFEGVTAEDAIEIVLEPHLPNAVVAVSVFDADWKPFVEINGVAQEAA